MLNVVLGCFVVGSDMAFFESAGNREKFVVCVCVSLVDAKTRVGLELDAATRSKWD